MLTCIAQVGAHAWTIQVRNGMAVTGRIDHISWGLCIAGIVPSTLHEWVEYIPDAAAWKVTTDIWAGG